MAERPDASTKPRSGVGLDELLGSDQPSGCRPFAEEYRLTRPEATDSHACRTRAA
jgi:hypothetical protein